MDYHSNSELPTHNCVDMIIIERFTERPPVDNNTVCVGSHDSGYIGTSCGHTDVPSYRNDHDLGKHESFSILLVYLSGHTKAPKDRDHIMQNCIKTLTL